MSPKRKKLTRSKHLRRTTTLLSSRTSKLQTQKKKKKSPNKNTLKKQRSKIQIPKIKCKSQEWKKEKNKELEEQLLTHAGTSIRGRISWRGRRPGQGRLRNRRREGDAVITATHAAHNRQGRETATSNGRAREKSRRKERERYASRGVAGWGGVVPVRAGRRSGACALVLESSPLIRDPGSQSRARRR